MFEKDAEKYRLDLVLELREKTLQGYDCQLSKLRDLSDIELAFQKGAQLGYNRANKWHFVKGGDLPEENQEVLIFFPLPDKSRNVVAISQFKDNDFDVADLEDVIAWKEIVFPEMEG
jgi:hypothetical protein